MGKRQVQIPNVVDLFAGAGGLSLGACRAGFNVAAAIEWDKFALETHAKNFPNSVHLQEDVSQLKTTDLLQHIGNVRIHGVIGGPPCQGFSSIGHQNQEDERNNLFVRFFEIVKEINPVFYLAENVPGILDSKFDSLRKTAFDNLTEYVQLPPIIVKANECGAPTSRTRVLFVGYRPTDDINQFDQIYLSGFRLSGSKNITVQEALLGLPERLRYTKDNNGERLADPEYIEKALSSKDFFHSRVVGAIPNGMGHQLTINKYLKKYIVTGFFPTKHGDTVRQRYRNLQYGQRDSISKSVRLNPEGYCPTLRAGTGPEKGSYQAVRPIHYKYPRVITPREAARLQGFPDWFALSNTIWHSFRQIGNSVSPLVAETALTAIRQKLT